MFSIFLLNTLLYQHPSVFDILCILQGFVVTVFLYFSFVFWLWLAYYGGFFLFFPYSLPFFPLCRTLWSKPDFLHFSYEGNLICFLLLLWFYVVHLSFIIIYLELLWCMLCGRDSTFFSHMVIFFPLIWDSPFNIYKHFLMYCNPLQFFIQFHCFVFIRQYTSFLRVCVL